MRTRIKICGVKSMEIARHATSAGADAIGLMFYPGSTRHVEKELAAAISGSIPPFVSRVGVFANQDAEQVTAILRDVKLDYLQFHGAETADFCAGFDVPYIKVLRVGDGFNLQSASSEYPDSSGIMLDTLSKDALGGTGEVFDWSRITNPDGLNIVLAGGLSPENVADAIRAVRPWAVDVSSGVETSGVKDPQKITDFCNNVLA